MITVILLIAAAVSFALCISNAMANKKVELIALGLLLWLLTILIPLLGGLK